MTQLTLSTHMLVGIGCRLQPTAELSTALRVTFLVPDPNRQKVDPTRDCQQESDPPPETPYMY